MVTPYEFSRIALVHGTVATVSDPHEIANVCGVSGIEFMLDNAAQTPMKFFFGVPSCVPATGFETTGAHLDSKTVGELLRRDNLYYLSEMMNYPGVLSEDPEVWRKIRLARELGKPVDGHAPGLTGADAARYIDAGITTDHECVSLEEAEFKRANGMKILIREGSAARNFDALHTLIRDHPESCMLCSDDKHPDDLLAGHINKLAARAVLIGHDPIDVIRCACMNPVIHYGLPVGQLRTGDAADFIVVSDLHSFDVLQTWVDGKLVAEHGRCILPAMPQPVINAFNCEPKQPVDFRVADAGGPLRVIEAADGQLITREAFHEAAIRDGLLVQDPERDLLKVAVVNRYRNAPPAVSFITNVGLKRGAIAGTVAHDSHNIIAVGADDESLCRAVNLVIGCRGGLSCVDGEKTKVLPLPVAGLMSDRPCDETGKAYAEITAMAHSLGSGLRAPYMTLSFMALLVIPDLKLSDKGLFSGKKFAFVNLQG